ncbi:hypothetical protein ANO14919_003950 [Xylariales sp. No.14919]|nr:hypothetical protein ANO14919_003950 [Xylariales sp. No.14919]
MFTAQILERALNRSRDQGSRALQLALYAALYGGTRLALPGSKWDLLEFLGQPSGEEKRNIRHQHPLRQSIISLSEPSTPSFFLYTVEYDEKDSLVLASRNTVLIFSSWIALNHDKTKLYGTNRNAQAPTWISYDIADPYDIRVEASVVGGSTRPGSKSIFVNAHPKSHTQSTAIATTAT